MAISDYAALQQGLAQFLSAQEPSPPISVEALSPMEDGHAGLTFGFDLVRGDRETRLPYILKMGPAGVPRRGSTDVFRQARLLGSLKAAGLSVPGVPWACSDEVTLGAPFIIMERLLGRTYISWDPDASFPTDAAYVRELWLQAVRTLGRLHRLDWTEVLSDWESPYSLDSELTRWAKLLRHAPEQSWKAAGGRLHDSLATRPAPEAPIGLVHGDFQPGNVLYEEGRLTGVIDWDLAGIGPQGIDVGWLLMMLDPLAWDAGWRPNAPLSRDDLLQTYHDAGGPVRDHLDWYQAFAQFRLGAIACLNVKLHRDGRRRDALWERFALSVLPLFDRGHALLAHPNRSHA